MKINFLSLPFLILVFFACATQIVASKEIVLPTLNTQVIDQAQFFTSSEVSNLSDLVIRIHQAGGPQIGILTVENLQENVIEEFSIKAAEKWQLGNKEKDNGLLILIAKEERSVRVEVGNGIEGEITDYISSYYTKDLMPQYFKRAEFYEGVRLVLIDIAEKFGITLSQEQTQLVQRKTRPVGGRSSMVELAFVLIAAVLFFGSSLFPNKPIIRGLFSGLFITLIFLPLVLSIFWYLGIFIASLFAGVLNIGSFLPVLLSHRGGSGGGGFGGGSGGGGWSGGGGGFSGGGSSGRW